MLVIVIVRFSFSLTFFSDCFFFLLGSDRRGWLSEFCDTTYAAQGKFNFSWPLIRILTNVDREE